MDHADPIPARRDNTEQAASHLPDRAVLADTKSAFANWRLTPSDLPRAWRAAPHPWARS